MSKAKINIKYFIEYLISVLILTTTVPLLLITALGVKLFLGSPILFKQTRSGYMGKSFTIYKFRSMKDLKNIQGNYLPDAQRLGKFGKFLRSSSLDELPELFNILKGDMTLIGPRPLLPEYLPLYNAKQMRRHLVKPGLTGLAQILGRNNISWSRKLAIDVYYVQHRTLWLDLKILLITPIKVFLRKDIQKDGYVTTERFKGTERKKNVA